MRVYDRDLIRGGHYGQRPRVPRLKAEHMAAPTNAAYVKKILANSEPSTHGTYVHTWHLADIPTTSVNVLYWGNSGHCWISARDGSVANDPKRTFDLDGHVTLSAKFRNCPKFVIRSYWRMGTGLFRRPVA